MCGHCKKIMGSHGTGGGAGAQLEGCAPRPGLKTATAVTIKVSVYRGC